MSDSPQVFLSHSTQDREVTDIVRRSLERSGIGCWIAPDCIPKGQNWAQAIDGALEKCSLVLCLLSESANKSDPVAKELDMAYEKKRTIIPLRIEDVRPASKLRFYLGGQWIDGYPPPIERHLGKIIDQIEAALKEEQAAQPAAAPAVKNGAGMTPPKDTALPAAAPVGETKKTGTAAPVLKVRQAVKPQKLALLYRRNAKPDDHVLEMLEANLAAAGHSVFVDRHMTIGEEWLTEIDRQVRDADAVVPLISEASVQSEMLSWEIKKAASAAGQQMGKPRILPVRVGSEGPLPEPFHTVLAHLQYALWNSPNDDQLLLDSLLNALDSKNASSMGPKPPPGPESLDSRYYIVQPTDEEFYEGLENQDAILLIKGARQMGKTSLLGRGLQMARADGKTVASIDFQSLNQEDLKDLSCLYKALCGSIIEQLELDVVVDEVWKEKAAPNVNFKNFIMNEVVKKREGHVIIAMDEVDRLFFFPYASDVFGMFRSWFNARTTDMSGMPWERLSLVFVYATEPHLFITDKHQSPFNVGTKIEMNDFLLPQVAQLNELYGSPVKSDADLQRLYKLLNGQPYLTRRAFYEMTGRHHMGLESLMTQASMDEGPFGDHLRRIYVMVAEDKKTLEVVTGFVQGKAIPDQMTFYNLRSGGLIKGTWPEDVSFRCEMYETYLKRHLGNA